jgi:hypothetical protein
LYIFQAIYLLIGIGAIACIFVGREKRTRLFVFIMGLALLFAGTLTLITGTIPSRRNIGPPITGGLAKIGGAFLVGFGLYAFYLASTHSHSEDGEDK